MIDLKRFLTRISVGKLIPTLHFISICNEHNAPGIDIVMVVSDVENPDDETFDIHQHYIVPADMLANDNEIALSQWLFDKVRDVLVHELQEFFKLDGKAVQQARHPL